MKIQNFKKIISSVLTFSMVATSLLPVFATEVDNTIEITENKTQETEVLYSKSATYFVTIPKTIVLDSNKVSNYSVKVEGDIPSDRNVYVAPIDQVINENGYNFYMKDQSTSNPKDDVLATTIQNKEFWNFEDVQNAYEETNNQIEASKLTAGSWKGNFDFEINLQSVMGAGLVLSVDDDVMLGIDSSLQINAYIDGTMSNKEVDWISDNKNIVVENGLIQAAENASIGETATITVSTKESENVIAQVLDDIGLVTVVNASDEDIVSFKVTLIDIQYTMASSDVAPGGTVKITAKVLPETIEGDIQWNQNITDGISLSTNNNEAIIQVKNNKEIGESCELKASFGEYSKPVTLNIVDLSGHTSHSSVGIIEEEATCLSNGLKKYTCYCGYNTFEEIKGSHVYSAPDYVCELCGDSYNTYNGYTGFQFTSSNYTQSGVSTLSGVVNVPGTFTYKGKKYVVRSINPNTFSTSTTAVTIPNTVSIIYGNAFSRSRITTITIPSSVRTMEFGAFVNCKSLKSIYFKTDIKTVVDNTCKGCTALTTVQLPTKVYKISYQAFRDCSSLKSIVLPETLKIIDAYAFAGCTNLTDIYFKGTEEQWNQINIHATNPEILNANVVFEYQY